MRLLHPAAALAIALAACSAPTAQWERPGASIIAIDEDLQRCRAEARGAPGAPGATMEPRGMTGTSATDPMEERDARAAQHVQKCMQAKGYSAMRR